MARKAEIELNSLETKFILEIQLPPIVKKKFNFYCKWEIKLNTLDTKSCSSKENKFKELLKPK